MAFRFRRRIKLAKGLHVNVSKTGLSLSLSWLLGFLRWTSNFSSRGRKGTLGVPGTGMSWSKKTSPRHRNVSVNDDGVPQELADQRDDSSGR